MSKTPEHTKTSDDEPRTLRSEDLLQGSNRVNIQHDGVTYTLLLTRNNRLILQK
ncbi:MAG: hemin uptake protein HemP [Planctomycetaceae bacterium]